MADALEIGDIDSAVSDAFGTKAEPSSKPSKLGVITITGSTAPMRANNPGALMPGGKLAQYKTPEEGLKAIDDNLASYGKKGVTTLADVITKWAPPSENDTASYIQNVARATGLKPDQQIDLSNPYVRHQISAGIVQQENGRQAIYQAPAGQAEQPSEKTFASLQPEDITSAVDDAFAKPEETAVTEKPTLKSQVRELWKGALKETVGMLPGVGPALRYVAGSETPQEAAGRAASAVDIALGAPAGVAGLVAYGAARPFGAETAETTRQRVSGALSQPIGRITGLTQEPGYNVNPITTTIGGLLNTDAAKFVTANASKGIDWLSQNTGLPRSDVKAILDAAATVAPVAATIRGGRGAAGVAEAAAERPRIEPTIGGVRAAEVAPAPQAPSAFGAQTAGAAQPTVRDFKSEITGVEAARGQYPQVKLSKTPTDVAESEQQIRAQILNDVMTNSGQKPGGQLRTGALTGNENTLRNEHATARLAGEKQTPESEILRQQFANEQSALSDYAEQRVKNTGASDLLLSDAERGERINSAFAGDEGLTGVIRQEKSRLYDNVRNTVGNNPIQSSNIDLLLQNKQFRAGLGLKGNEGVARSAEELINLAKTEGFEENGVKYAPNTVNGWIAVQKALNREWSPNNAGVIRQLNQAIERDIGAAGGLDTLKQADSLHQAEKQLFESKGIKELFGEIDPNGVEKGTPFEKILPKLNSMPINQWRHVYGTAERIASGKLIGPVDAKTGLPKWEVTVPDDLRAAAQSALQEMRGGLAREIYQAGAGKAGEWNANSVNKVLNSRADKIREAFSPAEQQAFHNLNIAGHIMPGVHAYEGAGQQALRVGGIVESHLPKVTAAGGAALGGGLFGPTGAAVGGYVAGKGGTKISESIRQKAQQAAAAQRLEELRRNAQKGTNPISGIVPPNP